MASGEGRVDFEEAGIAEQVRAIVSRQLVELGGGGEDLAVTVDGDRSTNDTLLLFATGQSGAARMWTCDLSADYVKINAEYRT